MKQFTMPIIFWLLTIEDEKIRKAAIRNAFKYPILGVPEYAEFDCLSEAIWYAFLWRLTPEKHDYWLNLYEEWKKL